MSLKTFTRAGRKALAIAVSAAMVAAFTPVTALGSEEDPGSAAGTAPSASASLSEEEAEAVTAGKYFKVASESGGPAEYRESSGLASVTTGTTVTLLDDLTISSSAAAITLPSGVTLDLNEHAITGEGLGAAALVNALDGSSIVNGTLTTPMGKASHAIAITGSVSVSNIDASSIVSADDSARGTLCAGGVTGVTSDVRANLQVADGALLHASVVYGNAALGSASTLKVSDRDGVTYEVGVQGDVTMGSSSRLIITRGSDTLRRAAATGLDGDLIMGESAEGALVDIVVNAATSSCAINNHSPITVSSSQTLTASSIQGAPNDDAYAVIAGDLSVSEGASVSVLSNYYFDGTSRYAVGGALTAPTGTYVGKIGEGSCVSGGFYSAVPSATSLAEGYAPKYTYEEFWGYKVVPVSTLSEYVSDARWGAPSCITSESLKSSYEPSSISFTTGAKSTGTYTVQFYKQQADGQTFKSVYSTRYTAKTSGARECNFNMLFHEVLARMGASERSGVYKFRVADWDTETKQEVSAGVYSGTYEYTEPGQALPVPTGIHWGTEEGKKLIGYFTLPEGASGFITSLYHFNTDTNSYEVVGGTYKGVGFADGKTEYSASFSSYPIVDEGGFYKFTVKALSFDLASCLDSAESEMSERVKLNDALSKVVEDVAQAESSADSKSALTQAGSAVVGTAMIADDEARETIAAAEDKFAQDNKVSVDVSVADAVKGIGIAKDSVVGAAFNAASNATAVTLQVKEVGTQRDVNDSSLLSISQFSMDLVETKADNTTSELGKDSDLDVPVCITIPIPSDVINPRILHYHGSNEEPETILPYVFEKDNTTYARFYVTKFSDFVLAAEPAPVAVEHEHVFDAGVVEAEPTCTADGATIYSCTVNGCEETKVVAIPALGHEFGEWTVTTPATTEAEGVETRTCSVCGEVETRSIPKLPGSNPGGTTPGGTTPGGSSGTGGSAPAATPHEHVFGEGVVTTPATCTTEGVMTYTCTQPGCGETKTEPIPALGHQFGEWAVTTPATAEAEGVETRTCSVCGEAETRAIAKLEAGEPGAGDSGAATPGDDTGSASEQESAKAAVGTTVKISGITYKVTAAGKVKVTKIAASKKTATLPSTIKVDGKSCKVVGILASVLKSSKVTKLIIKSKNLTKKGVKNALKGSKVTTVKVSVSTKKATNKSYIAKYTKYFTKANCGKKVTVK